MCVLFALYDLVDLWFAKCRFSFCFCLKLNIVQPIRVNWMKNREVLVHICVPPPILPLNWAKCMFHKEGVENMNNTAITEKKSQKNPTVKDNHTKLLLCCYLLLLHHKSKLIGWQQSWVSAALIWLNDRWFKSQLGENPAGVNVTHSSFFTKCH